MRVSLVILGLAIDNIRRIVDLRELGFNDPVKMVTSSPTILGYAIGKIRDRLGGLFRDGSLMSEIWSPRCRQSSASGSATSAVKSPIRASSASAIPYR